LAAVATISARVRGRAGPGGRVQLAQVPSAVTALERDLGDALFDRARHRAALTDAGQVLLPEAGNRREPGSVQRGGDAAAGVVTRPGAIARVR